MRNQTKSARVQIRGNGSSKVSSIAADKYQTISRAILLSLTKTPITFTELVARVTTRARGFNGSIPWYTITGLRELEVRRKVVRRSTGSIFAAMNLLMLKRPNYAFDGFHCWPALRLSEGDGWTPA